MIHTMPPSPSLIARAAMATLMLAAAWPAAAKPTRIMSMNLCADLLLLQLAPRDRIVSVSFLAHEAASAIRPGLDSGVAVNRGTAEDVAVQRPDLILVGGYSTPAVRRLADRLGAPVVEVKEAASFDEIRAEVRKVGRAVGEPARAEALVAHMDATLARVAAGRPARPIEVAAWDGGSVPGRGTLTNAIIEAAGAVNVGARLPDQRYGSFGLEELLLARPDALLYSDAGDGPSLRDGQNRHPALLRLYRSRRLTYPGPLYACGLPQSADAALALQKAITALPPGRSAP